MESLFIALLNMSLTASIVIVAVILVRLLLKRAPKTYSYILWIVVVFRLLCPVSIELSKAPVTPVNISHEVTVMPEAVDPIDYETADTHITTESHSSVKTKTSVYGYISYAWIVGVTAMVTWGVFSWVSIKSNLKSSKEADGYYTHDGINNSFIFGIIKPRIYIPNTVSDAEGEFILLHEKVHLKRCDHIAKIIMYAALSLHWFNPLVWLAFKFFEQDMEMSCDEIVTINMTKELRARYAEALLKASTKSIAAFTACFGESRTKSRISNMLKFKKPTKTIAIVCALLVAVTCCSLGVNKANAYDDEMIETEVPITTSETTEPAETTANIIETRVTETIIVETSPLNVSLGDGTYNCFISLYDVNEIDRLEIITWDYFELSSSEVESLQAGDTLSSNMSSLGEAITVENLTMICGTRFFRYGSYYDEIIGISDEYSLWHLEGTEIWRLFEASGIPIIFGRDQACIPLSNDLVIYDQLSYVNDGGELSENCYSVETFADSYFGSVSLPFQYSLNRVCIENGEVVSVTIYSHP